MREERTRQGLSQQQLAELVDETISTIQFIETLRQPTLGVHRLGAALTKIASALGVEYDYLFPAEYLVAIQKKILPKRTTLVISREVPMREIAAASERLALPAPDEQSERVAAMQTARQWVEKLPDRERQAIESLYGLNDGEEKTLETVGNEMGVTKERVRQLEAKGLRRLRGIAAKERLTEPADM